MSATLSVYDVRASLRRTDLLARYGGEEFVIIMPETDVEGALKACERVRRAVESFPFLARRPEGSLKVTASFGLACVPTHAGSKEELLERADQALYVAKAEGKNRTKLYSPPAG